MIYKEDIKKMKRYVIETYANKYCVNNYSKAKKIVENSVFNDMLKNEPEYIMHYSIEYWVDDIKREYDEINSFMLL